MFREHRLGVLAQDFKGLAQHARVALAARRDDDAVHTALLEGVEDLGLALGVVQAVAEQQHVALGAEGFFQAARGGTLFLDEIGDLPLAMQAKLLRAIQERRVRALGDTQEEAVDVRIVSATHKDLAAEVQAGRFRQDLFYRLNVIEIVVPPLRERREDLPALCQALLARIAADSGAPAVSLSARQMAEIAAAPLDGNVRELENLLHRAVALVVRRLWLPGRKLVQLLNGSTAKKGLDLSNKITAGKTYSYTLLKSTNLDTKH